MSDWLAHHAVPLATGVALVEFLWQGLAIAALTALALRLLRRAAAETRYLVSCVALLTMLITPVITAVGVTRRLAPQVLTSALVYARDGSGPFRSIDIALLRPEAGTASPWLATINTWLPVILLVWSLGVAALSVRLIGDWVAVRSLRRSASLRPPELWVATMHTLAGRIGIRRALLMAQSDAVRVPTVVGWLRPLIIMPASALAGLSPFQFEAILAHELAHVRRHDYLVNLLQYVIETVLFYHPAVWWLSARIRVEREHCCDDVAVSVCGDRVAYAGALATLETMRMRPVALALPADGGPLLTRVRRLLIPEVSSSHTRASSWALAAVLIALTTIPMLAASVETRAVLRSPAPRIAKSGSRVPRVETSTLTTPVTRRPGAPGQPSATPLAASQDTEASSGLAATLRVGGGIQEPKVINRVAPVYPPAARSAGIQGYVILEAEIGADGAVAGVRVLKSSQNAEIKPQVTRSRNGATPPRCSTASRWPYS